MLGLVGSARLRFVRWQSWRAALRGESKEKYGECENDPDATGTVTRGDLRSQQQGGPRDAGQTGNHRGRGREEECRVRATRHRPTGTRGPQSSHGAQPGDWRGHQDRGQEGREVPRGQERERCDCSAKEGEVVESTAQWYQKSRPDSIETSCPMRLTTITCSIVAQRLRASSTIFFNSTTLPFMYPPSQVINNLDWL